MWTQSLEQITINRDETNLEESRIIIEDNPPKPTLDVRVWGWPTPPVGRSANGVHLEAPPSYVGLPPPLRFNLRRCSRSVRIKGSNLRLPWIHGPIGLLVPPIKGPPTSSRSYPNPEIIFSHLRIRVSNQEKNSPP